MLTLHIDPDEQRELDYERWVNSLTDEQYNQYFEKAYKQIKSTHHGNN